MWCWRRMEKVKQLVKVDNEEFLERVKQKKVILNNILRRKVNQIVHILRRNCLLLGVNEGEKIVWMDQEEAAP